MKWKYLDLDKKIVTVKHTIKRVTEITRNGERKGTTKIYTPKTKESLRSVPIPNALIPKLKHHRLSEKEKCLKNKIKFSDDNFVFTNNIGNFIDSSVLIRSFHNFLKINNITIKKFHTLRHTYATELFKAGADLLTVSKLLGHTNLETTKIYTHVSEDQKEETANKLNKLFI